ncbi:MAG: sulfatase-like hydrolase/transferase [bacterium]|nr:sulfatase-like hydrolase/transferase [bacterium]
MATDRPNILFIMTDQQRGDCLGIEGHSVLQTPNLDYLAASGVRFRRAYSACPVCVPARRTVITGRKPKNHGALQNIQAPLPWPTLPGLLREAGYRTHLSGKAHWGPPATELGFETADWADSPISGVVNDYQTYVRENGAPFHRASDAHGMYGNGFPGRPWHLADHLHFTNWATQKGLEFIDAQTDEQPWFLAVNFIHPHQPVTPPAFYFDKYMAMDLPEPFVGEWARVFDGPVRGLQPECWRLCLDPPVMKATRAGYYGSIEHIDHQVARLLSTRVLPDNTIVVFASDHGEMLGDHQWLRKRNAFEPSARVPLLMKFPGAMGLPQQQVIDRPVELMDIMPTLLDAAGVAIPDTVDGQSVLPLIRDPQSTWREYVHGECANVPTSNSGMQYLTDGKHKYIWLPGQDRELFFDLVNDPNELVDLSTHTHWAEEIGQWRARLVAELTDRPEGFTDGQKLIKQDGPTTGRLPVWKTA